MIPRYLRRACRTVGSVSTAKWESFAFSMSSSRWCRPRWGTMSELLLPVTVFVDRMPKGPFEMNNWELKKQNKTKNRIVFVWLDLHVMSLQYLGARAPEPVKKMVLEMVYSWTVNLPDETKISDAYQMLKKQGESFWRLRRFTSKDTAFIFCL